MPVLIDFTLARSAKGTITMSVDPPTAIGGWTLQFQMTKRPGSTSGLVTKSMASGYYNVSGMNITNSGQGVMSINFFPGEVSGMDLGIYAYQIQRLDSGFQTNLTAGWRLMDY